MLDAAAAQDWTRKRVGDGAIFCDYGDVSCAIDKNAVSGQEAINFIKLRNEIVEKFLELRDEILRQIANLAADARVRRSEARAGEKFEKVVEFFALGEGVKEHGHRTKIERHGAKSHQMRRDARGLAANYTDRFSAWR